ncbi:hypothetical protein GCM10023169_08950 [Georgenia halophila]|uniref:Mechanosensitive ion channel MscS domain-containing protein n=1 Tax=Georgenia halophila TaxID=620889 RepID=A0ABP8KZL2_9MICO
MDADETIELTFQFVSVLLWSSVGLVAGFLAAVLIAALVHVIARGRPVARFIRNRCRKPFFVIGAVVGAWVGFISSTPVPRGIAEPGWRGVTQHVFLVLLILGAVWFVAGLIRVAEDVILERLGEDSLSNKARRIQTQSQVIRRVAIALVVVLGFAAILLTFPGARAAGASVLASAGIISVVAGLAAQTTLGSVFAGLQIALTDSLRVDDIVIVEGEFGNIEEITLTYVVVRIWDDRRMIMPSTYFTTTPFENWTRRAPALLGTVDFDVDWRIPVPAMRAELDRLLASTDLWDGRVGIFQVYDATDGKLRVRALVSGQDTPTLIDLKYYLREALVDWVQTNAPYALPRMRIEEQDVVEVVDDGRELSTGVLAEEMAELSKTDTTPKDQPGDTFAMPRVQEDPERRRAREAEARKARRRAEREDRRRAKENEGRLARREPRPRPSADQTVVMSLPMPERTSIKERTSIRDRTVTDRTDEDSTTTSEAHASSLFTGSPENEKRAQGFTGPGEEAYTEREQAAERRAAEQSTAEEPTDEPEAEPPRRSWGELD